MRLRCTYFIFWRASSWCRSLLYRFAVWTSSRRRAKLAGSSQKFSVDRSLSEAPKSYACDTSISLLTSLFKKNINPLTIILNLDMINILWLSGATPWIFKEFFSQSFPWSNLQCHMRVTPLYLSWLVFFKKKEINYRLKFLCSVNEVRTDATKSRWDIRESWNSSATQMRRSRGGEAENPCSVICVWHLYISLD